MMYRNGMWYTKIEGVWTGFASMREAYEHAVREITREPESEPEFVGYDMG